MSDNNKNPNQAHEVENEIFPSVPEIMVSPVWVEKSPRSLYEGFCPIFKVFFTLRKKSDGWHCTVKIGLEKFHGYSRNSKESALNTTWSLLGAERARYALSIPDKITWGDFNYSIPDNTTAQTAIDIAYAPDKSGEKHHKNIVQHSDKALYLSQLDNLYQQGKFAAYEKNRERATPLRTKSSMVIPTESDEDIGRI